MTVPASRYDRHTFTNGLRLLTVPLKGVDSVTILILVGVGSRYETARINGISHFLEHLFSKGSEKRPTALEIALEIDRIGGVSNAYTAKDHSGYYVKTASRHLSLAFDVLADMLLHPVLKPAEIEKERGVILEEINFRNDIPTTRIGDYFEALLFGDHPLGWSIDGRPEVIKSLTRKDFSAYIKDHYLPSRTVVAISGNIDSFQARKLVADYFADQPAGKPIKPNLTAVRQTGPAVRLHQKKTDQTHFFLGVRAYPIGHPRHYPAALLTTILGRGMSSRLFIEVREKRGLAYYISAHLEEYAETGYLAARAGVDSSRYLEAVKVIVAEMAKLSRVKVEPEELSKAKEYLKGRLILSLEDSMAVASSYATQELLEERIRTPKEIVKKIEAVTVGQIYSVARELFVPERSNLALIGPKVDEDRLAKVLEDGLG